MNNFKLEVLEFNCPARATKAMNEYIQMCNDGGTEILDITSHVTYENESTLYTFVCKVKPLHYAD